MHESKSMYIFHFVETYICFLEKVVEGTYLGFLASWLIVSERYSCDAFKHGTITRSGITRYFIARLALNKNQKMFRYQATKKKAKKKWVLNQICKNYSYNCIYVNSPALSGCRHPHFMQLKSKDYVVWYHPNMF